MSPTNEPRLTKAEKTTQARENARRIREAQAKKEKRNGWLIRGGVLVAAVAIVVVVALLLLQANRSAAPIADSGPVPAHANANGGVVLGKNNTVVAPPASTPATVNLAGVPTSSPTPTAAGAAVVPPGIAASAAGKPVQIVAYVDFICPICKNFEDQNGDALAKWRDSGKATVEYRDLGFLDRSSTTNYSSRAANAAACVVNSSPEKYGDYFTKLFSVQPPENSAGLKNDELKQFATDVGAKDISTCVDEGTFRPYVKVISDEAQAYGITGTPSVFVDGKKWDGSGDFQAFAQKIIDAKK
ncbi:thioredoxin domain-containing protein [Paenarthrobacter sp. Z7-10]|uniref:DsbA family protein n=1 Tax=Paenarthrobacter sp. Z7-10 TaxID=2787635 RepID=UPI0022A93989|nr:thioredoxin domain-containing protein [Paenarthrobacter sp. Z7-10]MCZ2404785.1 thioredoxin domain-containing protein [Paenarthrobacter sp. Z7-10]